MTADRVWPAHHLEDRPIGSLVPAARNARTHSDAQIAKIAEAITKWGFTNRPLIDPQGNIIAGHGRILAAHLLGIKIVPVMIAEGWSEADKRAYALADNQLALLSGWDVELLKLELADLSSLGIGLDLVGFTEADIAAMSLAGGPGDAGGGGSATASAGSLAARFGVAPFSVLNAREGWWQGRKAAWISLGIRSELGRGENLQGFSDTILQPDPAKRALAHA